MSNFLAIYIYLGLVSATTLLLILVSAIFPSVQTSGAKFLPYESGIQTQTDLFQQRFKLGHYLVGLIFLVFDIEVIFLYPWAVIAKSIGPFAFYEMVTFLIALFVGFIYVWRKRGLQWE